MRSAEIKRFVRSLCPPVIERLLADREKTRTRDRVMNRPMSPAYPFEPEVKLIGAIGLGGRVALDVGANTGLYSTILEQIVGSGNRAGRGLSRRGEAFDAGHRRGSTVTKRVAIVGLQVAVAVLVAACGSTPSHRRPDAAPARTQGDGKPSAPAPTAGGRGGYYLDDGPGENPPANLDLLPDAVPKIEKFASGANRPYNVFGVDYVPDLSGAPYRQRGVGSWYGRKFHGQRTSSGEIYDMYAMTAAHPTLPIPCYALVTNVQNGQSVIVRVNDRGPFLRNRIMDLSYAAALKLGYLSSGSGMIEVEMLVPGDIAAGRIPVTSNSLYIASAAANGSRPNSATATTTGATKAASSTEPIAPSTTAPPPTVTTVQAIASAPSSAPVTTSPSAATTPTTDPHAASPMAAIYAARGIPADLIPDNQPPAKLPEVATADGFYLQLGAFRVRAGADSFAAHVAREIDPLLASRVRVSDANGLFRVRVGPYPQREDADSAAASLRGIIAQPVLVMPDGSTR